MGTIFEHTLNNQASKRFHVEISWLFKPILSQKRTECHGAALKRKATGQPQVMQHRFVNLRRDKNRAVVGKVKWFNFRNRHAFINYNDDRGELRPPDSDHPEQPAQDYTERG